MNEKSKFSSDTQYLSSKYLPGKIGRKILREYDFHLGKNNYFSHNKGRIFEKHYPDSLAIKIYNYSGMLLRYSESNIGEDDSFLDSSYLRLMESQVINSRGRSENLLNQYLIELNALIALDYSYKQINFKLGNDLSITLAEPKAQKLILSIVGNEKNLTESIAINSDKFKLITKDINLDKAFRHAYFFIDF